MPTYSYRCERCGPFDVIAPMTASEREQRCPDCADPAGRVFSAPALRRSPSTLGRALEAQERSRHEPTVTTTLPAGGRRTPVSRDPRHARLPRP